METLWRRRGSQTQVVEKTEVDLAILKVAGFDLPYLQLGNSNNVTPGDRLVVIGNPLGARELAASVSQGVVSGIRDLGDGFRTIQTDAAVSPGHSGSPMLSASGEVIGVTSFRLVSGESLNFAIPINYLRGLQGMQGQAPIVVWAEDAASGLEARGAATRTSSRLLKKLGR